MPSGGLDGVHYDCDEIDIPTSIPSGILVRDDKYINNMLIKIRHYMVEYNDIFYDAQVESIDSETEFTVHYIPSTRFPDDTYEIGKTYVTILDGRENTHRGYRVRWKFYDE